MDFHEILRNIVGISPENNASILGEIRKTTFILKLPHGITLIQHRHRPVVLGKINEFFINCSSLLTSLFFFLAIVTPLFLYFVLLYTVLLEPDLHIDN